MPDRAEPESYVIRGGRAGFDRLQVLARLWAPTTSALFDRIGVTAGMRCLDLGCGSGDVTIELARRAGSDTPVVGIDMDEVKLELARESAAAQGLTNIEFRAMSAYDWSERETYDLVHARYVLQHLSRPLDVLRAMGGAVREGGVVVVQDADFEASFCYPPNAGFTFWVEAYQRALVLHGGDPLLGRRLHAMFVEAGLPEPELTVAQRAEAHGEGKLMPYLTVQATAEAIVSGGIATTEEVRVALEQLAEFAADEHSVCGSPRIIQAWARRSVA